jgi:hypothetical protein
MKANHLGVGFRVFSTQQAGPHDAGGAPARLETAWVVESPLGIEHPLEDRLEALLDELEPELGRLHQLDGGSLMHVIVGRDAIAHSAGCSLLSPTLLERLAALPGEGLLVEAPEPGSAASAAARGGRAAQRSSRT